MAATKYPGFIEKLRFVKNYLFMGCKTPWIVVLETGGKALTNAAATLLGTSVDDVARAYFRPKGGRSWSHGLAGRKKNNPRNPKKKNLIPETGEIIGKGIGASIGFIKPKYDAGDKFLWFLDTKIQQKLYYVLVVNLITDFAYDWFSGILADPRTHCNYGRGVGRVENYTWGSGTEWGEVLNWELEDQTEGADLVPQGWAIQPGRWYVNFAAKVLNTSDVEQEIWSAINHFSEAEGDRLYGNTIKLQSGQTGDVIVSGYMDGGTFVRGNLRHTEHGFIKLTEAHLIVAQNTD